MASLNLSNLVAQRTSEPPSPYLNLQHQGRPYLLQHLGTVRFTHKKCAIESIEINMQVEQNHSSALDCEGTLQTPCQLQNPPQPEKVAVVAPL
jgi:hypothetical protein